jgi:hypothetical protein
MTLGGIQARYDAVSNLFSTTAPRAMDGETDDNYRRRLLQPWLKHSKDWAQADLTRLDANTFDICEAQVLRDAAIAANNPTISAGTLVSRRRAMDDGHNVTEFFGSPGTWSVRPAAPATSSRSLPRRCSAHARWA